MKNFKPIIQKDLKDCGVCCMQWIIAYYKGFISLEKLREDTFTDISGTNAYHIVNAFKRYGFDASGVLEHDLTNSDIYFPCIVHLILENGLEHFVVVKKIIDDTIYLMDPSIGNNKMLISKFNKLFSGNVILVYPRGSIIKMDKGVSIGDLFFQIVNKEKFLIMKIIISSILWSILGIVCSYYLKVGSNLIQSNITLFKYLVLCFSIFTILKVVILYVRNYYENHLSNLVDVYLYPEFLRHLFSIPLKNIKSRSTGEVMTRIEELANIKGLFSEIFVSAFLDSLMMFLSIIILWIINKKLFIILLVFLVIYGLLGFFVSKKLYKKVLENINYQTNFNSLIVESIDMIESIKNLNVENIMLHKQEKCLSKSLFNNYKFSSFINISNLSKDFILEICFFIINSYGFMCVYQNSLSIVDLFTFNIMLSYCIEPVKNMVNLLPKYNYIKASFSKIMEFINIEEEKILAVTSKIKGDITFNNVSYSYNNYDYILNNINLKIKEKTHVLLNGPSGSGKSTICKLIYKENKSNSGTIYIGKENIDDINLSSIRKNILYVSQNEKLFTGSIKDNILLDRKVSEELFLKVCEICEIEEIVSKKRMRYESLIEITNGVSGGEVQRIILARGLLKNANIIILDEALSEVDLKLEKRIVKKIREYFVNKTIIYISHKDLIDSFECVLNIGGSNGIF